MFTLQLYSSFFRSSYLWIQLWQVFIIFKWGIPVVLNIKYIYIYNTVIQKLCMTLLYYILAYMFFQLLSSDKSRISNPETISEGMFQSFSVFWTCTILKVHWRHQQLDQFLSTFTTLSRSYTCHFMIIVFETRMNG